MGSSKITKLSEQKRAPGRRKRDTLWLTGAEKIRVIQNTEMSRVWVTVDDQLILVISESDESTASFKYASALTLTLSARPRRQEKRPGTKPSRRRGLFANLRAGRIAQR
jgi:hypothetical protein